MDAFEAYFGEPATVTDRKIAAGYMEEPCYTSMLGEHLSGEIKYPYHCSRCRVTRLAVAAVKRHDRTLTRELKTLI